MFWEPTIHRSKACINCASSFSFSVDIVQFLRVCSWVQICSRSLCKGSPLGALQSDVIGCVAVLVENKNPKTLRTAKDEIGLGRNDCWQGQGPGDHWWACGEPYPSCIPWATELLSPPRSTFCGLLCARALQTTNSRCLVAANGSCPSRGRLSLVLGEWLFRFRGIQVHFLFWPVLPQRLSSFSSAPAVKWRRQLCPPSHS